MCLLDWGGSMMACIYGVLLVCRVGYWCFIHFGFFMLNELMYWCVFGED